MSPKDGQHDQSSFFSLCVNPNNINNHNVNCSDDDIDYNDDDCDCVDEYKSIFAVILILVANVSLGLEGKCTREFRTIALIDSRSKLMFNCHLLVEFGV